MNCLSYSQRIGIKKAWTSLCTYLRGRRRNLEPLDTYKKVATPKRVLSLVSRKIRSSVFSSCFKIELFQNRFPTSFQ